MRIVDVALGDAHLSKWRGFIRDYPSGRTTPLEDVDVVMISAEEGSIGFGLLRWAADACVPIVVCDGKYLPAGMFLPIAGSVAHSSVLADQMVASVPCKKRFWASIVRVKISLQAEALASVGADASPVRRWISSVRSGDPDNREATAAAAYFSRMFGDGFLRRAGTTATNRHLDYGYAIVRAATARAAVACGLHPALPIHHSAGTNAYALADDLMEPFRAVVDCAVRVHDCEAVDLLPECKRALIGALARMIVCDGERMALIDAMRSVSVAWRRAIKGEVSACPSIAFDAGP